MGSALLSVSFVGNSVASSDDSQDRYEDVFLGFTCFRGDLRGLCTGDSSGSLSRVGCSAILDSGFRLAGEGFHCCFASAFWIVTGMAVSGLHLCAAFV